MMLFAGFEWTSEVSLTALVGGIATILASLGTYRKGKADARTTEAGARLVEAGAKAEEEKVDAATAKAEQKRKQDQSDWAVTQARNLYEKLAQQVDHVIESERRCQLRLAVAITRLRVLEGKKDDSRAFEYGYTEAEEELWLNSVLKGRKKEGDHGKHDTDDIDKGTSQPHQRPGD